MALHTSAASALVNTKTLSTQASLANEVANGNGYMLLEAHLLQREHGRLLQLISIVLIQLLLYGLLLEEQLQILNMQLYIRLVVNWYAFLN